MKKRIKALRLSKEVNLTQTDFGKKLNVEPSSVSRWESGQFAPSDSMISLICKTFGCDESWLRYGSGEMFPEKTEDDELQELLAEISKEKDPDKLKFLRTMLEIVMEAWPLISRRMDELKNEEK